MSEIATYRRHSLALHTSKKKRGREDIVYKMTNFKTDTTNN
jgi:hypothetical protein